LNRKALSSYITRQVLTVWKLETKTIKKIRRS